MIEIRTGAEGLCWHKVAATKRASNQRSRKINAFRQVEGMSKADP